MTDTAVARDTLRIGQALFHPQLGVWVTVDDTPEDCPNSGVRVLLGNGNRIYTFVADLTACP